MSSSPSVTVMETGFLSAVHDEEHFSSCFYSQGQGLDDSEGSLFGGMIVPDLDYDSGRFDPLPLWDSVGDVPGIIIPDKQMPSSPQCKEDFHKMFKDWQEHLTYMQVPESLKTDELNISTRLSGDIFTPASNSLSTPSIDDLFPLEIKQEDTSVPEDESNRNQIELAVSPEDMQVGNVEDKTEELASHVKKEIKLEIEENCVNVEIEGELSTVKEEIKFENEDDCVDIETVGDQMPVLEAGDLKSLLEQFEASEAVNGSDENKKLSILDSHLYNMVNQPASTSPSPPPANSVPTNQIIRDSLPKEVIDRIKASGRKKTISLIPAIPNKKNGRSATRMQDAAAALSRNKLLKLVTGGSSGESVQLDHDYCTSSDSICTSVPSSVYHSDNTDYPNTPEPTYSRLPDYYVALAPQKALEPRLSNDKWVEKNSKKDSGLESGDVSDASEETQTTPTEIKQKVVLKSVQGVKSVQVVTESGVVLGSAAVKQERKEMPMVSVLKKCNNNSSNKNNSNNNSVINSVSMSVESNIVSTSSVVSCVTSTVSPTVTAVSSSTSMSSLTLPSAVDVQKPVAEEPVKKKKLNLEEYRVRREERERIRSQENSRASSPITCLTPTQQPDSTSQAEGIKNEKPAMQSVEVQTVDFPEEELKKKDLKSRRERDHSKERRNDVRHRRYRARRVSSSSSSSSGDSSRHRSCRRRRDSRTDRYKSNNNAASRMWSRSRSRSSSHSSNSTTCSSRSRSRSRSRDSHWNGKWRSRSPRRSGHYNKRHHWRGNRRWQRRSPVRLNRPPPVVGQEWGVAEKMRQVEERRVIYVGRIEEGTTKAHLRERFQVFGPIVDISVHFRERGDNYGFVTFAYKVDAYEAVEHGNDDPSLPHYDLCFGGRRAFCKQRYADLDGMNNQQYNPYQGQRSNESFDLLLREAQAKLRKRSSV